MSTWDLTITDWDHTLYTWDGSPSPISTRIDTLLQGSVRMQSVTIGISLGSPRASMRSMETRPYIQTGGMQDAGFEVTRQSTIISAAPNSQVSFISPGATRRDQLVMGVDLVSPGISAEAPSEESPMGVTATRAAQLSAKPDFISISIV